VNQHEDTETHQNVGEEEIATACLRKIEGTGNNEGENRVDNQSQEQVKDSACIA
jgi:hypothetical protein